MTPGGHWHDPEKRARLRSGVDCVICLGGEPADLVAELEASWVTMPEDAPMRGYACLVFRRHAVEFHDLSESEGASFMRDIRRLSAAVQAVTGAVKLNYETHGNTIPHLHVHFYPRHPGDPFEGRPIDPPAVRRPVYAPGEFAAVRARLLEALAEQASSGLVPCRGRAPGFHPFRRGPGLRHGRTVAEDAVCRERRRPHRLPGDRRRAERRGPHPRLRPHVERIWESRSRTGGRTR